MILAVLHALAALLTLMALVGAGFAVAASVLLRGYRADPGRSSPAAPAPGAAPSVALLKPLHGAEPHLAANLDGFLRQDYPGATRLWLGVQDPADGALPAARALAARHPEAVRVVLDPRRRAANAKIGNVMNLEEAAAGEGADVVVLNDSDIVVGPGWLAAVVAALQRPGAGLATCLYFGRAARPGLPARLAAMGVSYGFLPQGVVGLALDARPAMGSTLALRRETLAAVGGFAAVKDVLADDYALGLAVRRTGLDVVIPPVLVGHDCAESSFAELWRHELRWAKTIRGLEPLGYAGSVVTHPAPLALAAVLLAPDAWWAWAGLAAAVLARLWLKGRVDRAAGGACGPWWLTPARDMLSLAVFVAAWFAQRVDWRGARFHVGRGGELTPV